MASIRDVAKLAQVAPSTVSLVLNNKGYVSESSRQKVLAAIRELNYIPNELARNLFRNCTNIIGVVVPDIGHPFFGTFIRSLELALYRHDYKVLVCSTIERKNGEREFVTMLKRQMIDGIIMGCHSLDIELYDNIEKPVIALDRVINEHIPIIRSDHEHGGELAAEKMIQAGVKHPLQIMGSMNVTTPAHLHHFVFEQKMLEKGIKVENYEMEWNRFSMDYFKQVAQEVFKKYSDIDGIYAADMLICACLGEAKKCGLNVPQDIKMVAHDGTFITNCGLCDITAVVQPIEAMAEETARVMIQLLQGEEVAKETILPVQLLEGSTC